MALKCNLAKIKSIPKKKWANFKIKKIPILVLIKSDSIAKKLAIEFWLLSFSKYNQKGKNLTTRPIVNKVKIIKANHGLKAKTSDKLLAIN